MREQHFRLQTSLNSFFPSANNLWNNLKNDIRNSPSLNSFKLNVKKSMKINSTLNKQFASYGPRKLNILHCRLRNRASQLNYDLFRANLINSAECQCGHPCEDTYHFFITCPLYANQRTALFNELLWYDGTISVSILCNGDSHISIDDNFKVAKAVQTFIGRSGRFD